jgi:hypothetical protein
LFAFEKKGPEEAKEAGPDPNRRRRNMSYFLGTFLFILLEAGFFVFVNWFFKPRERQCVPDFFPVTRQDRFPIAKALNLASYRASTARPPQIQTPSLAAR